MSAPSSQSQTLEASSAASLLWLQHLQVSLTTGTLLAACQMQPPPLCSAPLRVSSALSAHLPLPFLHDQVPSLYLDNHWEAPVCSRVKHVQDQSIGRMFSQPMHITTAITPCWHVALCFSNRQLDLPQHLTIVLLTINSIPQCSRCLHLQINRRHSYPDSACQLNMIQTSLPAEAAAPLCSPVTRPPSTLLQHLLLGPNCLTKPVSISPWRHCK